jgi:hypothetical protein
VRGMDIIYVDTPSGEAVEKSSSYKLSIFSSGADSEGAEVITAMREDSSPSVGELWPNIDTLDNPSHEDTSVVHARNASIHGKRSAAPIQNTNKLSRREGNRDSLMDLARILSAAPGAISPCMQRSFEDARYSPSTSMGLSEWEIILDELIHIGYVVQNEPDSDHNE